MILSCNSCEKKFVVPDKAITSSGRVVQCGSCGNKWKQFPIKNEIEKIPAPKETGIKKSSNLTKNSKSSKKRVKKSREINLYSPEYLKKKHGISLENIEQSKKTIASKKVSFGFYNSLILFVFLTIVLSKSLHFFQNYIVQLFPFTEFYIDYFFESIKNMFEIWKNLVT